MQASKVWQATYLPYVLVGCSLGCGMIIKDLIFGPRTIFSNNAAQAVVEQYKDTTKRTISAQELEALFKEADALFHGNETEQAIKKYKEVITEDPTAVMGLMRLGAASVKANKYEQAESYYRSAVNLAPNLLPGHIKLGLVQHKLNKPFDALRSFMAALVLQPHNFDALYNMSRICAELNQHERAIKYAKQAIALEPKNVHTYLNLGHIYNKQGNTHDAIVQYEQATQIEPTLANAWYNLGYTLRLQREPQKALPYLYKALELQPDYPEAHIALAQAYWSLGDFETAWQHYAWRWRQFGINPNALSTPLWDGSSLQDKTIFLYAEQGMGDTMQFIRYAKEIKETYNATILCKVHKPLEQLLSLCPYIDKIITTLEGDTPEIQAPLMDLPGIMHTTPGTIPQSTPYLYADKELVTHWKKKLAHDTNFKIGLCWNVLSEHERDTSLLEKRSIELKELTALADIPGISFYALQKTDGLDQVLYLPERFQVKTFGTDFDETDGRFMDTAALIANLDLVISVDTSVAHLAGGMGKSVWTLLPYACDCRWDLDDHVTPWYPTMRLFKQQIPSDWNSVVLAVKEELKQLVKPTRK